MVIVRRQPGSIILAPNCSASWKHNLYIITGLALSCLVAVIPLLLLGAWFVLPFLGLELLAVSAALFFVCRRLQHRQTLIFDRAAVRVEDCTPDGRHRWLLHRASTRINVLRTHHPWTPLSIALCDYHRQSRFPAISIGGFLNKPDSELLLRALKEQGLSVASDSPSGALPC